MNEALARTARILVVDDEQSVRWFAERTLTDARYDVVTATDGPDALDVVEKRGMFDLFVIDVAMPEMRGDELARRLRSANPDAKVLYFTGFADALFENRSTLWANEFYVEKPVTVNGLREAVSLALFGDTRGVTG